jgi:hypothetical protein
LLAPSTKLTLYSGHMASQGVSLTVASGFGTSPSVTGSDSVGRVTVGSGGIALTGVVNFAKTWDGRPPVCFAKDETTGAMINAVPTYTTLTLSQSGAFGAGDILAWSCQDWY